MVLLKFVLLAFERKSLIQSLEDLILATLLLSYLHYYDCAVCYILSILHYKPLFYYQLKHKYCIGEIKK